MKGRMRDADRDEESEDEKKEKDVEEKEVEEVKELQDEEKEEGGVQIEVAQSKQSDVICLISEEILKKPP